MMTSTRSRIAAIALCLTLCLTLMLSAATAQSLDRLAPPDALLVLDFEKTPQIERDLLGELAALDWSGAGETLETLGAVFGDELPEELGGGMSGPLTLLGSIDEIRDELLAECPSFPMDTDPVGLLDAGVLTVSVSPANPFPVLVMLGRVPSTQAEVAADINAALVECFGSEQLTQDGTTIHILGQGSDLPLAVAQVGDVWVAASTPDAVRSVIRRSGGSDEPSLADTSLWRATDRFEGTGFGIALDLGAAADLAQNFMGRQAQSDTPAGYASRRAIAAARTLGGVAARIGVSSDGLLMESVVAVNRDGGDDALADLLLCEECSVTRPFLAPSGSSGVTSQHVPLRSVVRYVDGWLQGLADITGEDLDLRALFREELGLDLDVALLDWVGSQVDIVTLAPFTPSLSQLIYQQPSVFIMPVSSQDAARQGLDAIEEAFGPVIAEMSGGMGSALGGSMGALGSSPFDGLDDFGRGADMFATREMVYRDIAYDRIQIGPTVDVAIGLVGNNLVIATPSSGMRDVIDTFRGDRDRLDDAAYRRVLDASPRPATSLAFQDVGANLAGASELGHAIAQPIAALLSAAAAEAATEDTTDEAIDRRDVAVRRTIAYDELPISMSSDLTEDSVNEFGQYAHRYRLTGIPVGERVSIILESDAFDTYLYLLDSDGNELDRNDDANGTDSALTVASDGGDYLIEVSSFGGDATGSYRLSVEQGTTGGLPQIEVGGIDPQPLKVPASGDGELTEDDRLPNGDIGTYFALDGLREGQVVEVELTSDAFDTYLRVVDPEQGVILAENDDNPDTSRSAVAFGATGDPVWVQVTSWGGSSTGPYIIDITATEPSATTEQESDAPDLGASDSGASATVEEAPEPVEPPSFAALLELTEIVPDVLDILSARTGLSIGWSHVDESVIYRRSLLEIDW